MNITNEKAFESSIEQALVLETVTGKIDVREE